MSGIEVAGLVLGALPILLKSVDTYRDSFRRFGTAFNKRKHVEKLARALLLQELTIRELIKSIILASGCEDVLALDEDPVGYLNNLDVQEQVEEYLGPKSTKFLIDELEDNSESVRKVARCISGLVPGARGPNDDLITIIEANQDKPSMMTDLAPRIKLLLGITDMKDMIQEIDTACNALDRFSRLTLSNCHSTNTNSSRNSLKLAKAFRRIHGVAKGLYNAVLNGFQDKCHDSHQARLYLDDRIDTAHHLLHRRRAADPDTPQMMFDMVFRAEGKNGEALYYETAVQVLDDYDSDDLDRRSFPEESVKAAVTFCVTDAPSAFKHKVATIASICTTIKEARGMKPGLSFALLGNRQMGTFPDRNAMPATQLLYQMDQREYISLSQILKKSSSTLPLKPRMQLSLRLASSLLQLFQTPWLTRAWCKDTVFFLVCDTPSDPTSRAKQTAQAHLNRPFVVCEFSGESPVLHPTEPKAALLELGIILLEIWHGMTLEARFGLDESDSQSRSTKYYERLVKALEWQDDGENPMLGLYGHTVSHCLTGNKVSSGTAFDWEDSKLWTSICSDIIEPLSKLCKNF
ncbi:hypothetical protein Daus18300_003541 [Diaporthe australafricana]|uniref:DUF7580 domain-containing protein n=1 Tax=Diaporthe australafricana TaxID=127596 RepID=A0ABR3XFM6_9PEZI